MIRFLTLFILSSIYQNLFASDLVNHYGLKGQIRTFAASTISKSDFVVGASIKWVNLNGQVVRISDRQRVIQFDQSEYLYVRANGGALEVSPFVAVRIFRWLTGAVTLPLYNDLIEVEGGIDKRLDDVIMGTRFNSFDNVSGINGFAVGDLSIKFKVMYPFKHYPLFNLAIISGVDIPTGQTGKGFFPKKLIYNPKSTEGGGVVPIQEMNTANNFTYTIIPAVTVDFSKFPVAFDLEWSLNYGFSISQNADLDFVRHMSTSFEYTWSSSSFFVDLSSETRLKKYSDGGISAMKQEPMYAGLGIVVFGDIVQFKIGAETDLRYFIYEHYSYKNQQTDYLDTLRLDRDNDEENPGYYQLKPMLFSVYSILSLHF